MRHLRTQIATGQLDPVVDGSRMYNLEVWSWVIEAQRKKTSLEIMKGFSEEIVFGLGFRSENSVFQVVIM